VADLLNAIANLVKAMAWPCFGFFALILFRRQISALLVALCSRLAEIDKLKAWGLQMEWRPKELSTHPGAGKTILKEGRKQKEIIS